MCQTAPALHYFRGFNEHKRHHHTVCITLQCVFPVIYVPETYPHVEGDRELEGEGGERDRQR